jgi:hypothetical protein
MMSKSPKDWIFGIVAYESQKCYDGDAFYVSNRYYITYAPECITDEMPEVGITSQREGGTLPAGRWLHDIWALQVIKEANAEWFLLMMARMSKREIVPMWEVAREYEIRVCEPMIVVPPRLPASSDVVAYCCRRSRYVLETAPCSFLPHPIMPGIRDSSWRGIIACRVGNTPWTDSDYCIAYCRTFYQDKPGMFIQRGQRGGMYSADKAWQDDWCREQIKLAQAEWFLPYLECAANDSPVAMWELHREFETRFKHPMYLLPPAICLDDRYCIWYSSRQADE